MRIAILGAGNVGGTLGRRWADLGHDVIFGIRNPERGASAVKGGGALPAKASVASPADAVRGAEVVVLATPWASVADALDEAGVRSGALDGKPLLDTTNPLKKDMSLDVGPNGESAGERVQALAPKAQVVKVFNTTGANNMADPKYDGASTVMFYAGDDKSAKQIAHDLATSLGFDAIDAGSLTRARELEHWAMLWISLAYGLAGGAALGRDFAFRVVRR
jgi:predicted dinucleotide-binding enzyme